MPHPFAGRGGDTGDVGGDRFGHVFLDEASALFFRAATDLADHDDGVGAGVFFEQSQDVQVVGAVDRVAADADAGGLTHAEAGQLPDGFVGQGAGARDDADPPRFVDVARHDADLAFTGGDDARAVGADQAGLLALHVLFDFDHVQDRDAFGDAADQLDPGVDGFHDGVGGKGGRDVDDGCRGAGLFYGFFDGVKDREAVDGAAAFAGGDTADHPGAVLPGALGVEQAGGAGDALGDDCGVFVDQDAHLLPPLTAATIFWAASAMPSAATMFRPLSASIFLPRSTLVPSRRTTSGTCSETCLAAAMTPVAMTSHFMMPPKMLTRMPRTFLSDRMILKASVTRSAVAPPPTSRKLAGSPP